MNYTKALIFTGGKGPMAFKRSLNDTLVIAADSGVHLAEQYGITPDMLVGDMDSIHSKEVLNNFSQDQLKIYDYDKDYSDTEIAIQLVQEAGISDYSIVGGGGGRLDHLIAIFYLFKRTFAPKEWVTHNSHCYYLDKIHTFSEMKGKTISFFPLHGTMCRAETTGLKWPLDELRWTHSDFGISNFAEKEKVTIKIVSGSYLMVINTKK